MRNLCCKCPHYYNERSWDGDCDWGCRIFGTECERCPSFWDDEGNADETEMGCNVHPKKMAFLINQENKRFEAWNKIDFKQNKLVKHYSILPKEERGYKAYRNDGTWMGFWTDDYRPNMKGGHTHNHIYNKCHKHIFRSKQARKNVDRKDKPEFVRTFLLNIKLGNVTIDSLMHTIFHHNKKEYK